MNFLYLICCLGVYVLASRMALRLLAGFWRELTVALLNLSGVYLFLFYFWPDTDQPTTKFLIYVSLVLFQFLMFRWFCEAADWRHWVAFAAPLVVLICARFLPRQAYEMVWHALGKQFHGIPFFVGISYLTFRNSRLVIEVRNGLVKKPGFWEYLGFSFFLPTMSVGPINTYSNYRRGFDERYEVPVGRAVLRILVGWIKFQFLSRILNQLNYSNLLLNGHWHSWRDLPFAMVFYYLFLYCNFSGFCDMAIGAAALMGIPVLENFDNPLASRNIREFWNRWHMTLSFWMRDLVFAPLSKFLVRIMGPARVNGAIALAIIVVFVLIGTWHGVGWNFVIYGAVHALGVVANHYYTIFLKKTLGRERFAAYNSNRLIHAAAVVLTFCFCAASLIFFANSLSEVRNIFSILR